jgi:uncharacterized membrane protein required for colicin V production
MHPIIFDLLIVLIVLISTLMGRRKGFILTLCGFLALFVALIGAGILTNLLAKPVSLLALPFVEKALDQVIQPAAEGVIYATIDQVIALMEQSDLLRPLAAGVEQAVEQGALDMTLDAFHAVAVFLAEQLTRLVMFPLFFLLIMLIWTVLSHLLDLAFHLPGLNFLNRTAGLLLGFARGVLLAYGLCWLLKDNYLPQSVIDGGLLLPWFCGSNPLLNISILNS